jgi:Domain of unknown function (DUF4157)
VKQAQQAPPPARRSPEPAAAPSFAPPSGRAAILRLQATAGNRATDAVLEAHRPVARPRAAPGGGSLGVVDRARLEQYFGDDFGSVRLHTDERADGFLQTLGATAVSLGEHVFLSSSGPPDGSPQRLRLLAHELAHILQHRHATRRREVVGRRSDDSEAEARRVADGLDIAAAEPGGDRAPTRPFPTAVPAAVQCQDAGTPQAGGQLAGDPRDDPLYVDRAEQMVYTDLLGTVELRFGTRWITLGLDAFSITTDPYTEATASRVLDLRRVYPNAAAARRAVEEFYAAVARTGSEPATSYAYVAFFRHPSGVLMPTLLSQTTVPKLVAAVNQSIAQANRAYTESLIPMLEKMRLIVSLALVAQTFGAVGTAGRATAAGAEAAAGGEATRRGLIAALRQAGVKFAETAIVGITRTVSGRIVWLETGSVSAGLVHIMQRHGSQFAAWGLRTQQQVGQLIINTLGTRTPMATQAGGAFDFAVRVGAQERFLRIVVASNGYVVTAHPITP